MGAGRERLFEIVILSEPAPRVSRRTSLQKEACSLGLRLSDRVRSFDSVRSLRVTIQMRDVIRTRSCREKLQLQLNLNRSNPPCAYFFSGALSPIPIGSDASPNTCVPSITFTE